MRAFLGLLVFFFSRSLFRPVIVVVMCSVISLTCGCSIAARAACEAPNGGRVTWLPCAAFLVWMLLREAQYACMSTTGVSNMGEPVGACVGARGVERCFGWRESEGIYKVGNMQAIMMTGGAAGCWCDGGVIRWARVCEVRWWTAGVGGARGSVAGSLEHAEIARVGEGCATVDGGGAR